MINSREQGQVTKRVRRALRVAGKNGWGLWLVLWVAACAPALEPQAEGQADASPAPQANILWTAQVSGVERYAGAYQGERGEAVVQDGRVLELELSNNVFFDLARFDERSVESPPLNLTYRGGGLLAGTASVVFEGVGSLGERRFFTGEAETDFVLEGGYVTGSLRFSGQDDVGQVVSVAVEDLRVPY